MCICLLTALFVHEKTSFFGRLVGHQIGRTRLSLGFEPKTFVLTDHCTTTRVKKDHLQTEGRNCFFEI